MWADDDEGDGPFHTDFKLSKSGEHIALVDVDGAKVLSSAVFGEQDTDVSTGRLFDDDPRDVPGKVPDTPDRPASSSAVALNFGDSDEEWEFDA